MAKRKKKQNNFWRAALVLLALLFVASTDKAKDLAKKASEALDDDENEKDSCSCCGCCDCQCDTKTLEGKVNVEKYQRTQDEDVSGLQNAELLKRFTTPNQTLHFEQKL